MAKALLLLFSSQYIQKATFNYKTHGNTRAEFDATPKREKEKKKKKTKYKIKWEEEKKDTWYYFSNLKTHSS